MSALQTLNGKGREDSYTRVTRKIVDLVKAKQRRIEDQLQMKKQLGRGRLSMDMFQLGNKVTIQCPKSLR